MLDACPKCGCPELWQSRYRGHRKTDPRQHCQCDLHLDCGWIETDVPRTRKQISR